MVNARRSSTRSFEEDRELVARVITKPPSRPVEVVKEKPPHAPKEPKSKRFFDDDELFERSFDNEELLGRSLEDVEELFARAFDEEELYARYLEARVIPKPSKPIEVKEKPPHAPKEPKSKRSFDEEELLFERAFDEGDDLYTREMGYWLD